MKNLLIVFVLFKLLYSVTYAVNDEEILQAMRDEIKRSMDELVLEGLKKPYYIEYQLSLKDVSQLTSVLGNIKSYDTVKTASLSVGLRVGDYKFDNTNFFDVGLSFFGSSDDEERFVNRRVPYNIDYNSLRRELWLSTDAAYKQSAELFSKKESSIQNRTRVDTTRDFLKIPVNQYNMKKPHIRFNLSKYKALCSKLSEVFRDYPEIYSSSVGIEFIPETVYYVNSEGIEYIKTEMMTGMEIVAFTQDEEGMPIADFYTVYSETPEDLPSADSLMTAAKNIAGSVVNIRNAASFSEPYAGPVLFSGQASAELFAQIFAPNLIAQRDVITESGVQSDDRNKAFQMRIGGRVLPDFLSVKAVPKTKSYNGVHLLGYFEMDDTGYKPEDVNLVENGYLKELLSERIPTRRVRESNGHKRGGAAMYSNLILTSNDNYEKSDAELKEKLIELVKARELEYGIIVKKIMNRNLMFTTLFRETKGSYQIPRGDGKFAPVVMYKIYQDGSEELIKGGTGSGFSERSFRDVIFTGKNYYVLNLLASSVISPFVSGGSQFVGASVITPDLLFEDGEIHTIDGTFKNPPILSNPFEK